MVSDNYIASYFYVDPYLNAKFFNTLVYLLDSWKKTKSGFPSMSGTTVACAIVERHRMYIANVGDSSTILGKINPKYGDFGEPEVIAEVITRDHKPEDEEEKRRIEILGGAVSVSRGGVMRVVWERKHPVETKPGTGESCQVERIPVLNMSRSLGDLWSVTKDKKYLISPIPDVYVHYFDLTKDKFVILASDGIWGMIKPQEAVETVYQIIKSSISNEVKARKASQVLIKNALEHWKRRNITADNISVLIGFFREHNTIDKIPTSNPPKDALHGHSSTMLHDEHLSDIEYNLLQANNDSTKQNLGKRAKQTDCCSAKKLFM